MDITNATDSITRGMKMVANAVESGDGLVMIDLKTLSNLVAMSSLWIEKR